MWPLCLCRSTCRRLPTLALPCLEPAMVHRVRAPASRHVLMPAGVQELRRRDHAKQARLDKSLWPARQRTHRWLSILPAILQDQIKLWESTDSKLSHGGRVPRVAHTHEQTKKTNKQGSKQTKQTRTHSPTCVQPFDSRPVIARRTSHSTKTQSC